MSIEIYTYTNPYELKKEPYWEEIKECPYFCVSQTLVNGLKYLYKDEFQQGRVTTVQRLLDTMYEDWQSTACAVKQHADIDNIISRPMHTTLPQKQQENLKSAFVFNREEVFKSIRTLFELNIKVQDLVTAKLSPEQCFIVEVYKTILASGKKCDFAFPEKMDEKTLDAKIDQTMLDASYAELDPKTITKKCIVIHGVHQFSPLMLRAIEQIAEYKKVILLFNYQTQYANVYQTWVDIYTAFDCPITISESAEFRPPLEAAVGYESNRLGDNLGQILNGRLDRVIPQSNLELLEFDNTTEFASYVAGIFQDASRVDPDHPMNHMREQIYAADSSVNNILKIYFPEQFGERQFLNFPLGHFFLAIADMWNPEENVLEISDMNDIQECLEAGILEEAQLGELSSIFGKVSALFEGCSSIDEMLSRLKRLKKNRKRASNEEMQEKLSHISYYAVPIPDIEKLEHALTDLEELAAQFYEDFERNPHNFKKFYKELKSYLQDEVLESPGLSEEFTDIVRRVLDRLKQVENIDTSASFECLKATMSLYLVQESKPGKSANWIVRNFEQIDGDILRSYSAGMKREPVTYHFACLSDEDMDGIKKPDFTWPLDDNFFEVAQNPVDWKYQVFVRSRKEYKNFKRYALLYGLEFNREKVKISYVKRDDEKEQTPYYLLKILGAHIKPYDEVRRGTLLADTKQIQILANAPGKFDRFDYYRFKICKYRFLLESMVEENTVYKDPFLLLKYLEVLIENHAREELQGYPASEALVMQMLDETYDTFSKYFPFAQNVNRMDIINTIRGRLLNKKKGKFPILQPEDRQYMMIRELFIFKQLSDPKTHRKDVLNDKFPNVTTDRLNEVLNEETLRVLQFRKETDVWCQYCANREFCAAYYLKSM